MRERPVKLAAVGVWKLFGPHAAGFLGAHRHAIANRLVNRTGRHVVRVEVAVPRIHPARDHHTTPRPQHRPNHRRIARSIIRHTDERLHRAAALHLVVILPNNRFLARHIRRSQNL